MHPLKNEVLELRGFLILQCYHFEPQYAKLALYLNIYTIRDLWKS